MPVKRGGAKRQGQMGIYIYMYINKKKDKYVEEILREA